MKLANLTPAETLVLLHGPTVTVKEVLKFSMMDLLFKQVIAFDDRTYQAHHREPVRQYRYVITGKNFLTYKPLNHERIFLSGFEKNRTMSYLFRNYILTAFQNSGSRNTYLARITSTSSLDLAFTRTLKERLFGQFSHSVQGLELRKQVKDEITDLEQTLPEMLVSDKRKAFDIIKAIKGNVFLLSGVNVELMKEIDAEFAKEVLQPAEVDYGCWVVFDTIDYHHHGGGGGCGSDDSNVSCGNDAGSGDSGCGGDGCGGCGGCGGD